MNILFINYIVTSFSEILVFLFYANLDYFYPLLNA